MNKDLQTVYDIFIKPYPNILLEYDENSHQYQNSQIIFGYTFDINKSCKMNLESVIHELMHLLHSTKKQRYASVNWGFNKGVVDIQKIYQNELPVMRDTYTILNYILKKDNYTKDSYINLLTATLTHSLDEVETKFKVSEFQNLLNNYLENQRDIQTILKEYNKVAKNI